MGEAYVIITIKINNFVTKLISKSIDSLNVFFSLEIWYIEAVKAVAEPPYTLNTAAQLKWLGVHRHNFKNCSRT